MLQVVESIRLADAVNRFGPAIIGADSSISFGQLHDLLARISNIFDERKLPRLAKVFLNIADRDARLIATIAALHYGVVPYVVAETDDIRDAMDIDYVVGGPALYEPDLTPDFLIDQAALEAAPAGLREFPDRGDDDILFISVSTGTTGRRKLIAETFRVFRDKAGLGGSDTALKRGAEDFWAAAPGERVLATIGGASPYGFNSIVRVLERRAALVRDQRNAAANVDLINRAAVTRLVTSPAGAERLLDHMEAGGIRCPSVQRLRLTGSLFHPSLIARLERGFDAVITVGYGTNEVGRISGGEVTAASYRPGYVGELSPELTVTAAGTREAPAQLTIRNASGTFAHHYHRGTLERVELGPYTLPDIGYVEGRSVYLIGRDDEVHNVSGNKLAFSALDAELRKDPRVRDVGIASGISIGEPTELYVALIGDGLDLAALMDRVIVAFGTPAAARHVHLFQVGQITRNATGKVDRGALLEAGKAGASRHA